MSLNGLQSLHQEINRLRGALEEINSQAVCAVIATSEECFQMLQNCAEISDKALRDCISTFRASFNTGTVAGENPACPATLSQPNPGEEDERLNALERTWTCRDVMTDDDLPF
jgi:hypothetical protein